MIIDPDWEIEENQFQLLNVGDIGSNDAKVISCIITFLNLNSFLVEGQLTTILGTVSKNYNWDSSVFADFADFCTSVCTWNSFSSW